MPAALFVVTKARKASAAPDPAPNGRRVGTQADDFHPRTLPARPSGSYAASDGTWPRQKLPHEGFVQDRDEWCGEPVTTLEIPATYSCRKALQGSVRAAFRAGTRPAETPTTLSKIIAPVTVIGSDGLTPYRTLAATRRELNARGRPMKIPIATSTRAR